MCFCFFFKQKTAYEMRISDWSSDVCSSDLRPPTSHACMWVSSNSHSTAATVHAFVMDDPSVICVLHPVVKEGAVVAERGAFSLQGMGWDIVGGCDGEGANHVNEVPFIADTGEAHGRATIVNAVLNHQRATQSH